MDDITEILDAFDRRLDPLVPTVPAPVTDLVRRGRVRRTRRRGLRAGLAAAVVVVAAATTTAVVQGRDAADPLPPAASTPPSDPIGETRTVGLDGIVVDVPADWAAAEPCSTAEDVIAFAPSGGSCSESRFVQLRPASGGDRGDDEARQNGLTVSRVDHLCGPLEDCSFAAWTTVTVADEQLTVIVSTPEADPLREQIADTVRPLPTGSVVVPDVVGMDLGEAKAVLVDARLDPPDTEPDYLVGSTDPEAGSVVPLGTPVTLSPTRTSTNPTTPPASDDTRTIGLDTLAVDVPADWVATGVRLEEPIDGDVRGTCNLSGVSVGTPSTAGNCTSTSYVEMDRLDVSERQGGTAILQAGLDLRRRDDVCDPSDDCLHPGESTTVWVDGEPLGLTVVTDDDELREQIIDSVRPVPDGFVAVPHVDGETASDAGDFLTRAGLVAANPEGDYVVGSTIPEAGSVVRLGSEVSLAPISAAD